MARGRAVTLDRLADLIWPDQPPAAVTGTLHAYVARLRRILEPERAARTPATVLVTVGSAYALAIPADRIDVGVFEQTVLAAGKELGAGDPLTPARLSAERLSALTASLDAALDSWRGEPYADLPQSDSVTAERTRLSELRVAALENRALVALHLGEHVTLAAELESLTYAYPLRERLWAYRVVALTRAGRQADALAVVAGLRTILDEELGLEPSEQFRDLHTLVLRQDPALLWTPPAGYHSSAGTAAAGSGQSSSAGDTADAGTAAPVRPGIVSGRGLPLGVPQAANPTLPDWPMTGRERDLARLSEQLAAVAAGHAGFAAISGEAGIGKSRLAAELAALAITQGFRCVAATCSQDEGAPPLWPWHQVLRGLGAGLAFEDAPDTGGQFRTWEAIVEAVLSAARTEPLLLILDDLHWADLGSLRVLRLLLESAWNVRLYLLVTWRPEPGAPAALGEAIEALARRTTVRIELAGLGPAAAERLIRALGAGHASDQDVAELTARTDGNPFFVVQYVRLAAAGDDLAGVLAHRTPPGAVLDVIQQRVARLPRRSAEMLRWASVVGRQFQLDLLAQASGEQPDVVLDRLEPAIAAGLVLERGIATYVFAHALVRDALYAALGATRAARAHAALATLIGDAPGHEGEVATHWAAAGPQYARRTWESAIAAGDAAAAVHAPDQAAAWYARALAAQRTDAGGSWAQRHAILVRLAAAAKWRGDATGMIEAAAEALELAEADGDLDALAWAASTVAVDALWRSAGHCRINERVVGVLNRLVDELPAGESEQRCRVLLALAWEQFDTASLEQRHAWIEQALGDARRLADARLIMSACQVGTLALRGPGTAPMRVELAAEALRLARWLGRSSDEVVCATLLAMALSEAGQVDALERVIEETMAQALAMRVPYAVMILNMIQIPWLAMAGEFDEAEDLLMQQGDLVARLTGHDIADAVQDARLVLALWRGEPSGSELESGLAAIRAEPRSHAPMLALVLLRLGRVRAAGLLLPQVRAALADPPGVMSAMNWAGTAELACVLDDPDLGASVQALLQPLAGQNICLGPGWSLGPADAFLALAARAAGDRAAATRHADRAQELMTSWRIPLCRNWIGAYRRRYDF